MDSLSLLIYTDNMTVGDEVTPEDSTGNRWHGRLCTRLQNRERYASCKLAIAGRPRSPKAFLSTNALFSSGNTMHLHLKAGQRKDSVGN